MSVLTTHSAMATVDAAYRLDGTDAEWLERVVRVASSDLDRGLGLYAATGRIVDGSLLPAPPLVAVGLDPVCLAHARALHPRLPCPILDAFAPRALVVGGLDEAWPKKLEAARLYREGMEGAGVRDALVLYARGGPSSAVKVVAPSPRPVTTHPRARATWGRVLQHVATALRLRRKVARGASPSAVVDVEGHVIEERAAFARSPERRTRALADLRAVMQARAASASDPERALSVFSALLAGRYSAVDRWDDGGRRYFALYQNPPKAPDGARDPRGLGRTEHRVAELVAHGSSLKEAAYALGITPTATQRALALSLRKLGLARSSDLCQLFVGARATTKVRLGTAELEVLVTGTSARSGATQLLTVAERDVAEAVLRGMSDADIARARGTSARTVANQMRRIFAKVGAKSRGELRAKILGP
jgi:DNA-binding CsgD family transcriptional regulator